MTERTEQAGSPAEQAGRSGEQAGSPLGSPGQAEDTARAVRTMFARVAPRYDFLNHLLSARFDLWWRRVTAQEVRQVLERPGALAADLCCGTGDLTFDLARFSAGRVLGADFCHPMLVLARQKQARPRQPHAGRADFLEADTLALPFAANSLDLVSAAFGFRNLASYAGGLHEMHRVLKPGGTVAILEFSHVRWPVAGPLFRFYFRWILPLVGRLISGERTAYRYLPDSVRRFPDQDSLARSLREAGFVSVRYRNFLGGVAALHLGEKAD